MANERESLNHFLVQVFNEILKTEEKCTADSRFPNLSLREIHILETVCKTNQAGEDNRSTTIASSLRVTPGTLTTAVSLLEKKGYLNRKKDSNDKRVVRLIATPLGEQALQKHESFHYEMIEDILNTLDETETTAFIHGLEQLAEFFRKKRLEL